MADNVIPLGCVTRLNIPADRVLEAAMGQLDRVVLIGWDKDEKEYIVSSIADGAEVMWLLKRTEKLLMDSSGPDR
jgi:hypothetical protein